MKRRTAIRIISFSLAAVVASVGFLMKISRDNKRYILELENSYSRNLDDFGSAINNISVTLNKVRFATSAEILSRMSAKLLTEAELSKTALSQLPAGEELTVLNRFLSQVGNYALSVANNLILGKEITQEQSEDIELLSSTANKIAELVRDSRITYNNSEYWAKELDKKIDEGIDEESLTTALGDLEGELEDFPTLVYDGPYSDHLLEKEPEMLKKVDNISEKEGLKIACLYAENEGDKLSSGGFIEGHIPSYRYTGEGITVAVTRNGGLVYYMRKEREVEKSLLSYEQALEKARRYLKRMNMQNFKETYYYDSEGVCVVNFAYLDGETICYTDLIKVGVAMDNGEIMLYEAGGYISNHKERAFPSATKTAAEAKEKLSEKLTLKSIALALIPTSSGGEERCYELAATSKDGQDILVYMDTSNLNEEEILILLKSDGGILVK